MRVLLFLAIAIVATGCGQGFQAANNMNNTAATGPHAYSYPTPSPTYTPVAAISNTPSSSQASGLTSSAVQSIGQALAGLMGGLFSNLNINGFSGFNFTNGSQSVTAQSGYNCPGGGSASVSGQGNLSTNLSLPSATGSLASASATFEFNNCVLTASDGSSMTLNGSLSLSGLSGSLNAQINSLSSATFNAQGSGSLNGQLQITDGSINVACPVSATNSATVNGTGALGSMSLSGTVNAQFSGSACGMSVNQSVSFSL